MSFATNIKKLRQERDLTQEQLAEILAISPQAISRWENDAAMPDISLLPALAYFFGVTTDFLLDVNIHKKEKEIAALCEHADQMTSNENYSDAVDFLTDAVRRFPNSGELLYRLAWNLTGTIREHRENLDKAIEIYKQILSSDADTLLREKSIRDLIYRYMTKGDTASAMKYIDRLPPFEVCREYNLGRCNLLDHQELSTYLQNNLRIFGNAMIECWEYFADPNPLIMTDQEMLPLTPSTAKEKIGLLRKVIE